ncbi:hypothetical protein BA6E_101325 [Bacteroidales bacterium 6E]|nr:hypothetical protein BA6E_101325 [Bacteroidales bacterium 6E]
MNYNYNLILGAVFKTRQSNPKLSVKNIVPST